MLFRDADSAATVITDEIGNDEILDFITPLGFSFSHEGNLYGPEGSMQRYNYWKHTKDGRTVILGFKSTAPPMSMVAAEE